MSALWIPVFNRPYSEKHRQGLVRELRRAGVDRAMLTAGRVLCSEEALARETALFAENKAALEAGGIRVGAWLCPTIGYGGTGTPRPGDHDAPVRYQRIRFLGGAEVNAYCPLSEGFADELVRNVNALCTTGVREVLFEDDFTLSGGKVVADAACCCPLHMAALAERLGRPVTVEELRERVLTGAPNPLRRAWLSLMGDTLRDLCRRIEKGVHAVYPDVRIGLSANSSSFIMEGVDISELAILIAGKNRPFLRLTGAPYWKNGLSLNTCIEAVRLQRAWCPPSIETFSEGDTYPRPRAWVSAAELECYDMILKAADGSDGILKYMLDYNSGPDYETGYVDAHLRHAPHYAEIARRFAGGRTVGLRVLETTGQLEQTDFTGFDLRLWGDRNFLPTEAQWLLADNSIPTTYDADAEAPCIAFGVNAHTLTPEQMRRGVILDLPAARLLMAQGVDVGAVSWEPIAPPAAEYFPAYDEYTLASTDGPGGFWCPTLRPGAEVLSEFVSGTGELGVFSDGQGVRTPAAYYYENADGGRFLVYAFIPCACRAVSRWTSGLYRNYMRQRQLADWFARVQGRPLPALVRRAPGLFTLCRQTPDGLTVGLWNLSPDPVFGPVELDGVYRAVDIYRGSGRLEGTHLLLDQPIPAYDFMLFTVS